MAVILLGPGRPVNALGEASMAPGGREVASRATAFVDVVLLYCDASRDLREDSAKIRRSRAACYSIRLRHTPKRSFYPIRKRGVMGHGPNSSAGFRSRTMTTSCPSDLRPIRRFQPILLAYSLLLSLLQAGSDEDGQPTQDVGTLFVTLPS